MTFADVGSEVVSVDAGEIEWLERRVLVSAVRAMEVEQLFLRGRAGFRDYTSAKLERDRAVHKLTKALGR